MALKHKYFQEIWLTRNSKTGLFYLFPAFQVQMTKRFGKFGKFTFSAHDSGQHFFCFQTNSTRFSVFAGERMVRTMEKSD